MVIKYERKPLSSNSLFGLAKPFGTIREHLVLKKKVLKPNNNFILCDRLYIHSFIHI